MYSINYTHQFKKDMRKCAKRAICVKKVGPEVDDAIDFWKNNLNVIKDFPTQMLNNKGVRIVKDENFS